MTDVSDRIEGILHEPTQVHENDGRVTVDLSVSEVYRVAEPGRVDFGGGELAAADRRPVETALRNPDDDYEWWHLDAGQYVVAFNESLAGNEEVRLQTRDAVRARGAFHPTLHVSSLDPVPFAVGGAGLLLKENARVSTVESI